MKIKKNETYLLGGGELGNAQTIAQILMLKAYYYNKPQTLQFTFGDENWEVTFTRENVEHLIPRELKGGGE